jgi:hypothetical protein
MTVIELTDEQANILKARAAADGLTLGAWLDRLAKEYASASASTEPLRTGRGTLSKYGPAPSAEEIDENRRNMVRNPVA